MLEIEIFLFTKTGIRVLINICKRTKDTNILVDNGMVNASVEIVATISVLKLVGITAMGEMLEVGKVI